MFISPMLAAAMPKTPLTLRPGEWVAEEKFDGHRIVVAVGHGSAATDLLHLSEQDPEKNTVAAWSREGRVRSLPKHIVETLQRFPVGVYDGELLVPGKRSYGVTEIVNGPSLVYTVFDVLTLLGESLLQETYEARRRYLDAFLRAGAFDDAAVQLSEAWDVNSMDEVRERLTTVWAREGEGLILKRKLSPYTPGPRKRLKDSWIKMKSLQTAVLEVVGFIESRGDIVNRGPFAIVVLRDEDGNETTVKTRNDKEIARLEQDWNVHTLKHGGGGVPAVDHPAVGRKLRIEYQERTPDGSYRHPRWDRWEDE